MADLQFTDQSTDWLIDWLADLLSDCLIDWPNGPLEDQCTRVIV